MGRMTASVIIEKTAFSFDKPYDYIVPENLIDVCKPGCRVVVPFGKGNTKRQGLVLSIFENTTDAELKSLISVADATPILNDEMLKLCTWLHETLYCTYFDAVNAVLPTGVSLKVVEYYKVNNLDVQLTEEQLQICDFIKNSTREVTAEIIVKAFGDKALKTLAELESANVVVRHSNAVRKMNDMMLKSVRPLITDLSAYKLTEKQRNVAECIFEHENASVKEICYYSGASVSVIDALVAKGIAEYFQKEVFRMPVSYCDEGVRTKIELTDEQENA